MNLKTQFHELAGAWAGTNRVWVMPGEPVRESETTASIVVSVARGFATIAYSWAEGGKPQDGTLLVRLAQEPGPVDMVWIDSWHTGGGFMQFRGEEAAGGSLSALGSYAAPPGPDWGWRIQVTADSPHDFHIVMHNIKPGDDPVLAVDARYARK